MLFMNEYDIADAVARTAPTTILGRAARFLDAFKDEVNAHSDGWPYWSRPVYAAKRLIELIERARRPGNGATAPAPTERELRAALTPIKAFYTQYGDAAGMIWPVEEDR